MKQRWILLADDDSELRETIRDTLTSQIAVRVLEVSNGQDALVKLQNQHFDVVITDYRMPRVNGAGIVAEISRLPEGRRPIGIIMISGFASQSEVRALGRVTSLAKPFKLEELVRSVNNILEGESSTPASPLKATVDVSFINPFVEGTLKVLETMCSTPASKEAVFLREAEAISGDVSALVAMVSDTRQGSFAVSFQADCFLGLVNRMLGESYTTINDENKDAAGELCNQIFGYAKQKLNEMGHQIRPAIPSVISGENHHIKHLIDGVVIAARFKTEFGTFVVEAAVN